MMIETTEGSNITDTVKDRKCMNKLSSNVCWYWRNNRWMHWQLTGYSFSISIIGHNADAIYTYYIFCYIFHFDPEKSSHPGVVNSSCVFTQQEEQSDFLQSASLQCAAKWAYLSYTWGWLIGWEAIAFNHWSADQSLNM